MDPLSSGLFFRCFFLAQRRWEKIWKKLTSIFLRVWQPVYLSVYQIKARVMGFVDSCMYLMI